MAYPFPISNEPLTEQTVIRLLNVGLAVCALTIVLQAWHLVRLSANPPGARADLIASIGDRH